MKTMEMLVVDAQLLKDCLYAFNEIPNRKLCNGKKTYDLASQLDRVFREHKQNDNSEVLQRYVDGLAMGIIRDVNIPFRWQDVPYLSRQVMTIQTVVKALNMVDRFNYNMDMLGREDLIVPVASNEAA
ncbi:TPA: hypothetical protein ACPHXL_003513 [Vibrio alginolyticus]|uniref:hypothetical protein n=1 Tax=Vibrio alginolyticus TaxID=663 RepID=UPI002278CB1A|nr:hypothetical protein [Vibrio alginolyticus]WAE59645.1 hypothetical protein OPR71_24350 [Vibrio alginolyticus]